MHHPHFHLDPHESLASLKARLLTIEHAAEWFEIHPATFRRLLLDTGVIPIVRISARIVRVRVADLVAYIDDCILEEPHADLPDADPDDR